MSRTVVEGDAARPVEVGRLLRDQRGFLVLVAAVGLWRLKLLWRGPPGSAAIWGTMLALWACGALWGAYVHRRGRYPRSGDLLGIAGVQNVAIQVGIGMPATLAGVLRLAGDGVGGLAFASNALVTVIALPAFVAIVLTFGSLLLAVPARALLGGRP